MLDFITEALMPLLLFGFFSVICILGARKAILQRKKLKKGNYKKVLANIDNYTEEHIRTGSYSELRHILTVSYAEGDTLYVGKTFTNSHSAKRYKNMQKTEIYLIDGEDMPLLKEHIRHIYIDSVLGIIGGVICVLFTLLLFTAMVFYVYEKVTGRRLMEFI